MNLLDELINEWKFTELKSFASELKIPNRSKMNKNELAEAITEEVVNAWLYFEDAGDYTSIFFWALFSNVNASIKKSWRLTDVFILLWKEALNIF